jgi:hypothetical protein
MIIITQLILFVLLGLIVIFLQRFFSKNINLALIVGFIIASIFVFFPKVLSEVAAAFGIGRGVDFAFYITIPLIAIVAIRSGLSARRNGSKIVQLTRVEAIEKFKLRYTLSEDRADKDKT